MAQKILLADNDSLALKERKEFLEKEGYHVLPASNPTEARRLLEERKDIDLAILDLRLKNDDDERDISGLTLAKETKSNIPKIILTKFPTYGAAREALTASVDGLPPAVEFVDKREGLETLLRAVRKALQVMTLWFRATQDAITRQLHEDYAQARKEARTHYRVCLVISLLGGLIVLLGAALALNGDRKTGVASAVSGIITSAINLLFIARLNAAYRRVDKYHEELLQSKRLENLLSACGELSDPKGKEAAMREIIQTTTRAWMRADGAARSPSTARRGRGKKVEDEPESFQ
jgi:CheY-like chemotaxis protein